MFFCLSDLAIRQEVEQPVGRGSELCGAGGDHRILQQTAAQVCEERDKDVGWIKPVLWIRNDLFRIRIQL